MVNAFSCESQIGLEQLTKAWAKMYSEELRQGIEKALHAVHWDGGFAIGPLRVSADHPSVRNCFISVEDSFSIKTAGYIFPFRKVALAMSYPFDSVFANALNPRGYTVYTRSSHRQSRLDEDSYLGMFNDSKSAYFPLNFKIVEKPEM